MPNLQKKVLDKILKVFTDEGIEPSEEVFTEAFRLTEIPDDKHLTNLAIRRAELEAKDMEEDYFCFMCGRKYNDVNELLKCMQSHVDDFVIGIPIDMVDGEMQKRIKTLKEPVLHSDIVKKNKK